jgi:hypothetical protein
MQQPTWLDEAIQKVIDKGDPAAIAQAIANSPQVLGAIKKGLANKPKPGVMGPSYAQNVAKEVREAIAAV